MARAGPAGAELGTVPEPLAAKIREEVLYREALAMGLDKDDIIVNRRMSQKMDFLAEDLSAFRDPTREELRSWLKAHPQDFAYPPRITFRHLYFCFDKHREQTREAAAAVLARTAGLAAESPEGRRDRRPLHVSRRVCPNALRTRWAMSSAQSSPARCSSKSPARGRGRSSRASAGT